MVLSWSYSNKSQRQEVAKTPASTHSRKRRYAAEQEQISVSSSAFHCMPVRSTSKMASIAARFATRGRWQPSGCTFAGQQWFDALPQFVAQAESIVSLTLFHGCITSSKHVLASTSQVANLSPLADLTK
jgi:hypothetical protein